MATEENKALLRRFIELWNTGKVETADEFVSADLIDHSLPPGLPSGLLGFKLLVGGFRAAFPDLHISIDHLMAQGDKAAARVTFRGTQQGEFQGIPATGKSFSMGAIGILRFKDGEVVEHWAVLDLLGLLTQLGVAPAQHNLPYSSLWPVEGDRVNGKRTADSSTNLATVQRFFDEVCNARRLEVANELYDAHHRYYDPSIPGVADGPAGIQQPGGPVVPYQTAFSDAHWHVEEMLVEGDMVVTRWYGTGTQDGDLPGIPPAGKQVNVPGIWYQRLADGKIVESWQVWDTLRMLQQLGVIPVPEGVTA
ncbi:MAG TPA: ester cyclase [Anaerolineales bacterium]|nr:ester cyclase [Anaerolineales bacterium]